MSLDLAEGASMAKLTVSDAARVAGVARSTLHRAIRAGRLSIDPDGHIDTAELLRAGYTLQGTTPKPRHNYRYVCAELMRLYFRGYEFAL
jgi:hypothetical protein